jgi:hypothetical protein
MLEGGEKVLNPIAEVSRNRKGESVGKNGCET